MDIEEYLYSKLIATRDFNLRKKEIRPSFAGYVFELVLDVRSGNPWQSALYVLHDTEDNIRFRKISKRDEGTDAVSVFDKWSHDDGGVIWLSPEIDRLYPNHQGIALRDDYLAAFETQDTPSLCRALVDLCANVIRRFHEDQNATQLPEDQFPILLEILGVASTLKIYAQDHGLYATPMALQDQYLSILGDKNHDVMIENGMNIALSRITLANKIAQELTEYISKCRAIDPLPTLSELSPIERSQYEKIRAKLEEWLPNTNRYWDYSIEVFGTCRPGLTAFQDVATMIAPNTFFMTSDEYGEYRKVEHDDERDTKPTIHYRWHTFEQPNLNVYNPIVYGNNPIKTTYPIPEGNQYWIEQQGSYTGPLHAGSHSNLWQSDATEMTLITGLSHWIS